MKAPQRASDHQRYLRLEPNLFVRVCPSVWLQSSECGHPKAVIIQLATDETRNKHGRNGQSNEGLARNGTYHLVNPIHCSGKLFFAFNQCSFRVPSVANHCIVLAKGWTPSGTQMLNEAIWSGFERQNWVITELNRDQPGYSGISCFIMISQHENQLFEPNGKVLLMAPESFRPAQSPLNPSKTRVNTLKYACARVSTDTGKYFSPVIGRGMKTSMDYPSDFEALLDAAQ